MATIKGVYFDWGGVLIEDPFSGLMEGAASELGIETSVLKIPEDLVYGLQSGTMDEPDFWTAAVEALSLNVEQPPTRIWGKYFRKVYREKKAMFELAARLQKTGLKTGLLSNTEMPGAELFESKNYSMIETRVYSCTCGFVKPDPRIYEYAIDQMGLEPGEIVFFDDKAINIEAANKVGLQAHQYLSHENALAFVRGLGVEI